MFKKYKSIFRFFIKSARISVLKECNFYFEISGFFGENIKTFRDFCFLVKINF